MNINIAITAVIIILMRAISKHNTGYKINMIQYADW